MEESNRFTISLPPDLYKDFETFRKKLKMSRSDCIRKAMKSFMISEKSLFNDTTNVIGTIITIMTHSHFEIEHEEKEFEAAENEHVHNHETEDDDHHEHDFTDSHLHDHSLEAQYTSKPVYATQSQKDFLMSNDIQHHYADIIKSSLHIHIEFEKCLEIIAMSGTYERVKNLHQALQSLKSAISSELYVVDRENMEKEKKE